MITEVEREASRVELGTDRFQVIAPLPNDHAAIAYANAMTNNEVGPGELIGGGHAAIETNAQELMGDRGMGIETAKTYVDICYEQDDNPLAITPTTREELPTVMFISADADLENAAMMGLVQASSSENMKHSDKSLLILSPYSSFDEGKGITDEQAMEISLAHDRPVIYSNVPIHIQFINGDLSVRTIDGSNLKSMKDPDNYYNNYQTMIKSELRSGEVAISRTREMSQKVKASKAEAEAEECIPMDVEEIGGQLDGFRVLQTAPIKDGSMGRDDGVVGEVRGRGQEESKAAQPEQKKLRFSGVGR